MFRIAWMWIFNSHAKCLSVDLSCVFCVFDSTELWIHYLFKWHHTQLVFIQNYNKWMFQSSFISRFHSSCLKPWTWTLSKAHVTMWQTIAMFELMLNSKLLGSKCKSISQITNSVSQSVSSTIVLTKLQCW